MTLYDWTYCRSCHANIYWLTNETTGKAAPIDVQPPKTEAGAGNIEIDLGKRTYRVVGKQLGRHTSHFQTCPNVSERRDLEAAW